MGKYRILKINYLRVKHAPAVVVKKQKQRIPAGDVFFTFLFFFIPAGHTIFFSPSLMIPAGSRIFFTLTRDQLTCCQCGRQPELARHLFFARARQN